MKGFIQVDVTSPTGLDKKVIEPTFKAIAGLLGCSVQKLVIRIFTVKDTLAIYESGDTGILDTTVLISFEDFKKVL
jgi:hypothetical protein